MSKLELGTAEDVIRALGPGRVVTASPGCGTPTTLLEAIAEHAEELAGPRLYSGMLLGDYPFLCAVDEGLMTYGTWHVMAAIRRMVADGRVPFFPIRGSQVPALIRHLGVDAVLLRVSPPDRHGFCSTGPSVSYPVMVARHSRTVIVEIDATLPRTRGEGIIHIDDIAVAVESTTPMPEYPRAKLDDVSRAIARRIIPLLPENPTLQLGIGSIPEALVDELRVQGIGALRFAGMAVDGMADLHDEGLIERTNLVPYPPIMAAELMGTRRLMDFAHENPIFGVYTTEYGITAGSLSAMDRFISINSALEIDRLGQINAEWVGDTQLSGVGGSIDFTEAAMASNGGMRIIAMAATNVRDASTKVVAGLNPLAPITLPRHSTDYVVTEHGVARLSVASTVERAERLAAVAAPEHRGEIMSILAA